MKYLFRSQTQTKIFNIQINQFTNHIILGPHRVFPGRLSVSRTFGDVEAKEPALGGIKDVISSEPDIFSFKIDNSCDFIVLGCK